MTKKEKLKNYAELLYLLKLLEYQEMMKNNKEEVTKEKSKVLVLKKKFYGRDLIVG